MRRSLWDTVRSSLPYASCVRGCRVAQRRTNGRHGGYPKGTEIRQADRNYLSPAHCQASYRSCFSTSTLATSPQFPCDCNFSYASCLPVRSLGEGGPFLLYL